MHINKIFKMKKEISYNKLNSNLNEIYKFLLATGFYNIINEYNINFQNLESKPAIPDWNNCSNRMDHLSQYYLKNINLGIEFFESPCRLGRKIAECSYYNKNRKVSKDILNDCVFCQTLNRKDSSLCYPFRQMKMIYIDGLIILPNPFPYFKRQFLITADVAEYSDHYTQTIFQENFSYFHKILKVSNELCKQKDGMVFFNGLCGNSLKHFHCQFAIHKLPIFSFIDDVGNKENFIKIEPNVQVLFNNDSNKYFRGIVFSNLSLEDLGEKVEKYIVELSNLKYLYNFIIRRKRSKLQMVLFIRNCKTKKGTVDFNFGSTELGGSIVNQIRFDDKLFKEKDIIKYLDETNNVRDIIKVVKKIKKNLET